MATRREMLNVIAAGEMNDEVMAWAAAEIEKMNHANELRRNKMSKKAKENAPIVEAIVKELTDEPQTATVELTLRFNMLGNAVGMYDWMLQNSITSLEDKDLSQKLQPYAHSLGGAIERHLAQINDCYLTPDELVDVFPSWLQVVRIASTEIGPRLAKPITMATPTDKKHTPSKPAVHVAEPPKTTPPPPRPAPGGERTQRPRPGAGSQAPARSRRDSAHRRSFSRRS